MFIFPSGIPSGASGYQPKGAIFTDGSNDYFSKTDYSSSGSSDKVMSCGGWFKVCEIANAQTALFAWTRTNNSNDYVRLGHYYQTGQIRMVLQNTSDTGRLDWYTKQYMRDPSAWFHIVWTVSTNGEAVNKLWINGSEVTEFTKTTDSLADGDVFRFGNSSHHHSNFADPNGSANNKSIYASQMFYQDGQKVTDITDYGEFNDNGIWVPKDISGLTFGTNGYLLDFADSSNLGNDVSGRNNDLTVNGSMSAADLTNDRPVNSESDDLGNYCIWNPLTTNINASSSLALSDGNLVVSNTASEDANVHGSFGLSSGKWYFEVTVNTINEIFLGVSDATIASNANSKTEAGAFVLDLLEADKYNNDGGSSYGSAFSNGDVANVAVDLDNGKIWIGKDGTYPNSGNPATGSNEMYSGISGTVFPFLSTQGSGTKQATTNFGQSSFTTSAPTGFKAVATHNMTEPTITKPSDHFQAIAYEGTSASTLTVDTNFQADWVWIKERTNSRSWHMYDSVRGEGKALYTNGAWVEDEDEVNGYLDQFNATNVRLTNGSTSGVNVKGSSSSNTYVMYAMKAGGAASSNSDGTITSNVSANTTAGFSIVSYTGNSTADATVGHGLSSTPELIIVRNREGAESWAVWHKALAAGKRLDLNLAAAEFTTSNYIEGVTSDVFQLSSSGGVINNGDDFIAYCWHSVEGFSKIGSYEGNGNANGPFIYLGFKPAFIMTKNIDASAAWAIHSVAQSDQYNDQYYELYANASDDQGSLGARRDFLANGTKIRNASSSAYNTNNKTYIYMAFAETPFASNNRAR